MKNLKGMNLAKQIDLPSIIQSEGFELKQVGRRFVGNCPFHNEQNPSFYVFDDGHFHCFGCGEHGDAIDFVRKRYGYNFPEALNFLGIEQDKRPSIDPKKIRQKKKELLGFKQRECDLAYTLGFLIRVTHTAMAGFTIKTFNEYGQIIDQLAYWEYAHDILIHGSKDKKRQVLEALKDMPLIERNRIFNANFDFSAWLRNFIK
jgi:DNA primase